MRIEQMQLSSSFFSKSFSRAESLFLVKMSHVCIVGKQLCLLHSKDKKKKSVKSLLNFLFWRKRKLFKKKSNSFFILENGFMLLISSNVLESVTIHLW